MWKCVGVGGPSIYERFFSLMPEGKSGKILRKAGRKGEAMTLKEEEEDTEHVSGRPPPTQ